MPIEVPVEDYPTSYAEVPQEDYPTSYVDTEDTGKKLRKPNKPEASWAEVISPSTIIPQVGGLAGQWLGGRLQSIQENAPKVSARFSDILGGTAADKYPMGIPEDAGRQVYDYFSKLNAATAPNVEPSSAKDYTGQILTNVAANLPTMLYGGLTGQANKALIAMGEMAAGQKYGEMRAAGQQEGHVGASPVEAGIGSTITGVSEALTEKLPLDALIKPGLGIVKRIALSAGLDVPGELLNTIVNSAIDKYTTNPNMSAADFYKDLKDTAIISLGAAGLQGAAMHPVAKYMEGKAGVPPSETTPNLEDIFSSDTTGRTEVPLEDYPVEYDRIQAQQQQEQEAAVMPEVQTPVEEIAPSRQGYGGVLSTAELQKQLQQLIEARQQTEGFVTEKETSQMWEKLLSENEQQKVEVEDPLRQSAIGREALLNQLRAIEQQQIDEGVTQQSDMTKQRIIQQMQEITRQEAQADEDQITGIMNVYGTDRATAEMLRGEGVKAPVKGRWVDIEEQPKSVSPTPTQEAPIISELKPAIPPDGKINSITREQAGKLIAAGDPAVAEHIRSGLHEGIDPAQMQDAIRNQTVAEVGKADTKEERQQIRANVAKIGPEISAALKSKGKPKAKEPWEMTRDEFLSQPHHPRDARFHGDQFHHDFIREAISKGKPVPAEVLKDYPELRPQAPTTKRELAISRYVKKMSDTADPSRAGTYTELANKFAEAIKNKDVEHLRKWMNGINPKLNRLFTEITGLPAKTQKEADTSIRSLSPEAWDALPMNQPKVTPAKMSREDAFKKAQEAKANKALEVKIKHNGEIKTKRQFLEDTIDAGYTVEVKETVDEKARTKAFATIKNIRSRGEHNIRAKELAEALETKENPPKVKNYRLVKEGSIYSISKTEGVYAQERIKAREAAEAEPNVTETPDWKQDVTKIIDRNVFNPIVVESIQKDGQKVLDAVDNGDVQTLEEIRQRYSRDKGLSQGGRGAGPKKVNQARRGATSVWEAANMALERMTKPPSPSAITLETGGLQTIYESLMQKMNVPESAYSDLLELGKYTYQQGHDTGTKFFKAMRDSLGKMWNAYKKQVVKVWAGVRKWNAGLGEQGAIRNPFAGEPKLDEALISKAKEHFGITYSPKETGYITPDGIRLDLTGRHYAVGYQKTAQGYKPLPGQPDYLKGARGVDHREILEVIDTGGTEGMMEFLSKTGSIRYMPGTGISMTTKPTPRQIEMVVKDFRSSGDSLFIDIDTPDGQTIVSKEFVRPNYDEVMKWIEKAFSKQTHNKEIAEIMKEHPDLTRGQAMRIATQRHKQLGAIRNPFAGEPKLSEQGQKVLDFLQKHNIKAATPEQFKKAGVSDKEANIIYERLKGPVKAKERKLYGTFQRSETTTEGMKETISQVKNKEYIVKPNIESLAEADKIIAKNKIDAEKSVMTDDPLTAVKAATFIRLIHEYQREGKYSEAVELFEAYARQATEAGQGIQVAAVWNRLTPEGFLKWAEKQIDNSKKNQSWMNKGLGRKATDLTNDEKAKILEDVTKIHKLPQEKQNKAWTDLIDTIAKKLPPTISEIIDAYRYQNMLSGWQTHERNIGENMFNTWITRPWEITTEGAIDHIKSTLTGKERKAYVSDVADYYKSAFNALPNAVDAYLNAWHGRTDLTKPEIGVEVKSELEKARFRQMPKYLTIVARFMEASDRFNTTLIAAGQYAASKKQGLSDADAADKAEAVAENYLYRDKLSPGDRNLSIPSKALAGFGDIIMKARKEPGALGTAIGWMVPFVRTPINKGIAMIERSPLGLVRTNFNNEAMARVMTGGIITAIGTAFALMGATTWSAPDDDEEKKVFYATGRKPFSIRIGDAWVPVWYFGPYALALALPAAVKHHYRESKKSISHNGLEKLVGTVSAVGRFIGSQSSAQSIENFIKLLNGDIDYSMKGNLAFSAGQFVPASGLLRNINKLVDPAIRKPDSFVEHMKKDIPFLSESLIQRRDPLGQPVERLRGNALLPYEISPTDMTYENIYPQYQAEKKVKYAENKIKGLNAKVRKGEMSAENADKQFKVIIENLAGLNLPQNNYKTLQEEEE